MPQLESRGAGGWWGEDWEKWWQGRCGENPSQGRQCQAEPGQQPLWQGYGVTPLFAPGLRRGCKQNLCFPGKPRCAGTAGVGMGYRDTYWQGLPRAQQDKYRGWAREFPCLQSAGPGNGGEGKGGDLNLPVLWRHSMNAECGIKHGHVCRCMILVCHCFSQTPASWLWCMCSFQLLGSCAQTSCCHTLTTSWEYSHVKLCCT